MLLKKLSAVNSDGSVLELPLDDNSGGFLVKEIQGLGPAKATLASSAFAGMDGAQYHTGRLEPRNVVIKLGLTPDYATYSVYELRSELYNFFMPKSETTLKFEMFNKFTNNYLEQTVALEIVGRIESFEIDQFSKDPTVDMSVMCFHPELVDPELSIFEGTTVDDLTEMEIPYLGTLSTGLVFTLNVDRAMEDFAIYHRPSNQRLYSVNFIENLLAGDVVTINSNRGEKGVTLLRGGVEYHRLYSLSTSSDWLELQRGTNHLRVYSSGTPVPYKLEWKTKYGGL